MAMIGLVMIKRLLTKIKQISFAFYLVKGMCRNSVAKWMKQLVGTYIERSRANLWTVIESCLHFDFGFVDHLWRTSVHILYVTLPFRFPTMIFFCLSLAPPLSSFLRTWIRSLSHLPHILPHTLSWFSSQLFISVAFFTDARAQETPETSAPLSCSYFISVGCASQIFVTVCATEEGRGQVWRGG